MVIAISAYRPCIKEDKGLSPTKKLLTVAKQHTRYYQEKGNILEPDILALFDRALLDAVKTWLDMGDSVVLGIDMNDDVRTSTLTKGLQELGLFDAVLILHSPALLNCKQLARESIFVTG